MTTESEYTRLLNQSQGTKLCGSKPIDKDNDEYSLTPKNQCY